jgi:hypothetical protein
VSSDDEATNFSRRRNPWTARESVTVPSRKLYVARSLVFFPRPHGDRKVGGAGSFLSEDRNVARLSAGG